MYSTPFTYTNICDKHFRHINVTVVSANLIKFTNLEVPSNRMNSSIKRSSSDYKINLNKINILLSDSFRLCVT